MPQKPQRRTVHGRL